jgi:hypothetical protein
MPRPAVRPLWWIFFVNVPVGAAVIGLSSFLGNSPAAAQTRADIAGMATFTMAAAAATRAGRSS